MSGEFVVRLLVYAELLYSRAVEYVQGERFRRAAPLAASAGAVARFLVYDPGSPQYIRERGEALNRASKELASEIHKALTDGYGDRHISGEKPKEEDGFWRDVDELAQAASRFTVES